MSDSANLPFGARFGSEPRCLTKSYAEAGAAAGRRKGDDGQPEYFLKGTLHGGAGLKLDLRMRLSGRFAFTLAWTPERMPEGTPPPGIPTVDPNGPPLVTALQEQLGLKLQAARSRMEVVVIDSIDQPTPD